MCEERVRGEQFPIRYRTRVLYKDGETKEIHIASVGIVRFSGRPAIMVIAADKE